MLLAAGAVPDCAGQTPAAKPPPISVVVMDPLALPLSCDCVKGHAQRNYDLLGSFLEKRLGRKVQVAYSEDLAKAIRLSAGNKVDLIIGKQSVVKSDAAECKLAVRPVAMLSGKDGLTTLTGLFCVPAADPAQTIADLAGYRVIFGPPEAAEKHSAALAALEKAGVAVPERPETAGGCSEAAFAALENEQKPGAAAVISSYAMAVLEGCGTIDKGALRVIGRTGPVPFIRVFATDSVTPAAEKEITGALLAVRSDAGLLVAMESKHGFLEIVPKPARRPTVTGTR